MRVLAGIALLLMAAAGAAAQSHTSTTTTTTTNPPPTTTAVAPETLTALIFALDNHTAALEVVAVQLRDLNASLSGRADRMDSRLDRLEAAAASQGDNVTRALARLSLEQANASFEVAGLAAYFATIAARTNQTTQGFEEAQAQLGRLLSRLEEVRGEVLRGLTGIDHNMTNDHVKLYRGVYISDPNDPRRGDPAYLALMENDVILATNQGVTRNETRADLAALGKALTEGTAATREDHNHHAATLEKTAGRASWGAWLSGLLLAAALLLFAFVFWPEVQRVRRGIEAGRAQTTAGLDLEEEPSHPLEPSPFEMRALRAEARRHDEGALVPPEVPPVTRAARRRFQLPAEADAGA